MHISGSVGVPAASPAGRVQDWLGPLPKIPAAISRAKDALPKPILHAMAIRARLMRDGAPDLLRHLIVPLAAPRIGPGFEDDGLDWTGAPAAEAAPAAWVTHADTRIAGSHKLRVRAVGRDPLIGSTFVRLGLRSVVVRAP